MQTSGLVFAIHSLERSKPRNTRCQYGSDSRWLSIAAPIAGTCDEVTPAMILATFLSFRLRLCLRLVRLDDAGSSFRIFAGAAAVALDLAAAAQHQVGIVLLGRACHHCCKMLERMAVGRAELGGEIDVAAELEHPVVLALEDRLFLIGGELRKILVEIAGLV